MQSLNFDYFVGVHMVQHKKNDPSYRIAHGNTKITDLLNVAIIWLTR